MPQCFHWCIRGSCERNVPSECDDPGDLVDHKVTYICWRHLQEVGHLAVLLKVKVRGRDGGHWRSNGRVLHHGSIVVLLLCI